MKTELIEGERDFALVEVVPMIELPGFICGTARQTR
jgi:hypothetical protein